MSRSAVSRLAAVLLTVLPAASALGFDPPVDRAGPVTARIEGPKEVTRLDTPMPVGVVVENAGDRPVEGTVAIGLTDRWTVVPDRPRPFELAPGARLRLDFQVKAGAGTLDALYPIHAHVRFDHERKPLTAHPVLIVPVRTGAPPLAQTPRPAGPYALAAGGRLALWQLPARRALVQVSGRPALVLSAGRDSDETTGASVAVRTQDLGGVRKEVVAIHPPWRDGRKGTAALEFPVVLPDQGPVRLRFENAVIDDGKGDGVTFRVRVAPSDAPTGQPGQVVFERHTAAKRWGTAGEADLGRFAGRSVRIQLESHPGPANDTGWDQSFWAEPTLLAGPDVPSLPFPPPDETGSSVLGTTRCGDASAEVRLWPGRRGLLDAVIGFTMPGRATLHVRGFQVRVLGARLDDPRSPIALFETRDEDQGSDRVVRHRFRGPDGAFDLVIGLSTGNGVLSARFRLENTPAPRPWQVVRLEEVALGPFSRSAKQVYAGIGNVVRDPGPFRLHFDGHQLATSFVGLDFEGAPSLVQAVDVPPDSFEVDPAQRHYSIHAPHAQTMTLIPAARAFDGARRWHDVNGLKPAGGVARAAGRFVFDLWGGNYAGTAAALRRSFRYGLGGSMVVFHNWQRWGYDYRLPDIYPPSPRLGTESELKDLIAACKATDTLFALHDNYIDFYPDADEFSYERNIAFDAAGRPVKAWLHESRDAQSYRYRADRAGPYLKRNLGLIRDNLAPTAYFIDVWSSAGPYDYWTFDGQFGDRLATRKTWGSLFAWIRDTLGGNAPQISESGHDQLIGWLDGAQTNHLRVGKPVPNGKSWTLWNWPCADAERTPWSDAAHHDRFVLHGAGYPGRYEAGLPARDHGIYSDDYMATEVLTGHPAMVAAPFGANVVRKHWLLNDLMRALALRRIEEVEYVGGDLHRQRVRWSGGGEAWVNRGETDWTVAGRVLPQYGFLARATVEGGTVEAAIERLEGQIVESSRSPGQVYVNARGGSDDAARIVPRAAVFERKGARDFFMIVEWRTNDPVPAGYVPFYHFCDEKGEIAFQGRSSTPLATKRDRIRADVQGTVPTPRAGQSFELRVGLYDPKTGGRLELAARDDGDRRVGLGKLSVGADGALAWAPATPPIDATALRNNPERLVVAFGPVTTAFGARVGHEAGATVVTPLPSTLKRTVPIQIRTSELPWKPEGLTHVQAVSEDGRDLGRGPVQRDGDTLSIECGPGVFQYRLVGGP